MHIQSFIHKRSFRYLAIGASVYIVEVVTILSIEHLGGSSFAAVTASFWLGVVLSFALQKAVTFQDHRLHHRVLTRQIIGYGLLLLWNYGFTLLMVAWLSPYLSTVTIRTIAILITTIWNYYVYRTHLFGTTTKETLTDG